MTTNQPRRMRGHGCLHDADVCPHNTEHDETHLCAVYKLRCTPITGEAETTEAIVDDAIAAVEQHGFPQSGEAEKAISYDTYTEGEWRAVLTYLLSDDEHNPIDRDEIAARIVELITENHELRHPQPTAEGDIEAAVDDLRIRDLTLLVWDAMADYFEGVPEVAAKDNSLESAADAALEALIAAARAEGPAQHDGREEAPDAN